MILCNTWHNNVCHSNSFAVNQSLISHYQKDIHVHALPLQLEMCIGVGMGTHPPNPTGIPAIMGESFNLDPQLWRFDKIFPGHGSAC